MKNERRDCLEFLLRASLAGCALNPLHAAWAQDEVEALAALRRKGRIRIAVYKAFTPFSNEAGKGIDCELGRALAAKLGLEAEIAAYASDEDMSGDFRNMVWKGHYMGTPPADVMMHVPVDERLARANDKVRIFGAYYRETLAVARNPDRVPVMAGSAAVALEVFTREKIGVERVTMPDAFLMAVLGGRIRENVSHFADVGAACAALKEGQVAAVFAPRSELESALQGQTRFPIEDAKFAELKVTGWPLGLAVKAEADTLAQALGDAMAQLKREGVVADIFKRHGISYVPA